MRCYFADVWVPTAHSHQQNSNAWSQSDEQTSNVWFFERSCAWDHALPFCGIEIIRVRWLIAWQKNKTYLFLDVFVPNYHVLHGLLAGSRNRSIINTNQCLDPKVSFLVLPGIPGSSHGPHGAKVEAPGLPNDRFRAPTVTISVSKMITMCWKRDLEINIQEQSSQHTFQQRN